MARPGSATTSGSSPACTHKRRFRHRGAGRHALGPRGGGRRGGRCARGAGRTIPPGASPTTGSAWGRPVWCSRSMRSPTAPATAAFRAAARAGAARLRQLTANGTRPLPRGSEDGTRETGFLSGSAGAAYMFLERYARDHDPADLATARRLLGWVNGAGGGGRRGRPVLADQAWQRGDAGGLRAWRRGHRLGEPPRISASPATAGYRDVARRAAMWLRSASIAGSASAELPGDPTVPVHVGLDSGAAGIGWVLHDLARAGIDPSANRAVVRSALAGLRDSAAHDTRGGVLVRASARRAVAACVPSRHGTGARPGSPRSPHGSPAGPAPGRAGSGAR